MGFISDAKKNNTGSNMVNIYNQTVASINQVTQNKASMNALVASMKINSKDFNEEDWKELEALVTDIDSRIEEL